MAKTKSVKLPSADVQYKDNPIMKNKKKKETYYAYVCFDLGFSGLKSFNQIQERLKVFTDLVSSLKVMKCKVMGEIHTDGCLFYEIPENKISEHIKLRNVLKGDILERDNISGRCRHAYGHK